MQKKKEVKRKMSSLCKRFSKKINKHPSLRFDLDMYNNLVGSLVISAYILSEEKPSEKEINKRWAKLKKKGMSYWLEDPKFLEKTLAYFDLKVPYGRIAMVQSDLNALFFPYVDGEILPVREDGVVGTTALTGKIYPIEAKVEKKEEEEKDVETRQGD